MPQPLSIYNVHALHIHVHVYLKAQKCCQKNNSGHYNRLIPEEEVLVLWAVVIHNHLTRYTHAHHVPHVEHVESSIEQNGNARSAVETTPYCPLPIPLTGQLAK